MSDARYTNTWAWCPDGKHRQVRVVGRFRTISSTGVRWLFLCSWYSDLNHWDIYLAWDSPDASTPLRARF